MLINNTPLVSVIVPCYKVEQYLPNCIESVILQTYENWELILVDDGSPDDCGKICDDYGRHNDRIKVIHKKNGGLSSARNAGMRAVTGTYVTFLDSDDFLHPDALKTFVSYALEKNADIVQCGFVRGSETHFPIWGESEKVQECNNHSIFTKFLAKIIVWAKLYKRELLDGITMPEGIINEDDWTTWKIYYRAKNILVTNRPLYYYTINPNSIMRTARKKPDTTYYGAYDERIDFFSHKGEKDLEEISRFQFCKSLLLSYSNEQLSVEQRKEICNRFDDNWKTLRNSSVIPTTFKMLFWGFSAFPDIVSKLTNAANR